MESRHQSVTELAIIIKVAVKIPYNSVHKVDTKLIFMINLVVINIYYVLAVDSIIA